MTTTLYFKRLLSISLLSIAFVLAISLCFAQSPKAVSKDRERLANYVKVIQGYLSEVKGIIKTNSAGQEYIAELLLVPEAGSIERTQANPGYIGDYLSLPGGNTTSAYNSFKVSLEEYIAGKTGFEAKHKVERLAATGELVYDAVEKSNILKYKKMGESGFPVQAHQSTDGSWLYLRVAGQQQSLDYSKALVSRNAAIISLLSNYIDSISAQSQSDLAWNSDDQAPVELFSLAKQYAKFSYELSKKIKQYKVAYAQRQFYRSMELYEELVKYYNLCYDIYTTINGSYTDYFVNTLFGYQKCSTTTTRHFQRISWRQGIARIEQKINCYVGPSIFKPELEGFNLDQVRLYPDYEMQRIPEGIRSSYQQANATHKAINEARVELFKKLKSILDRYKPYLPYNAPFRAEPDFFDQTRRECEYDFYRTGGIINFIDKPNNPPVADVGEYPDKKMPCSYQLSPIQASDADKDTISYRWVITHIPETEVRSLNYVLYQKLSDSQAATLIPDLASNDPANAWEVTLELNDGKDEGVATTPGTLTAKLNPIRHILWIQHSNGPYDEKTGLGISLELYAPQKGATLPFDIEWGGPYYLEVAHEKAEMYQNYDDEGKPVDEDSGYLAPREEGKYCFKVFVHPYNVYHEQGLYDGTYGSTDIVHPQIKVSTGLASNPTMFYKSPSNFTLSSASDHKCTFPIEVMALDPQITDLVLANESSLYGQKLAGNKTGTYYIQQWVDHYAWLNLDGKGFKEVRKNTPNAYHESPDWMERRAAKDVLNNFPAVLPYVSRIKNLYSTVFLGMYPGGEDILINPGQYANRYNLPWTNNYGFYCMNMLDSTARHEAHHAFYGQQFMPPPAGGGFVFIAPSYFDMDCDRLPNADKGGMFAYLLDSGNNLFGGYGPVYNSLGSGYLYEGDKEFDVSYGRKKYLYLNKPFDFRGYITSPFFTHPLPANIPIDKVNVEISIILYKPSGDYALIPLQEGLHFTYLHKPLKQKTTQPDLYIRIDPVRFKSYLDKKRSEGWLIEDKLYIFYDLITPHEIQEYDASRIGPGQYTGGWKPYPPQYYLSGS